MKRTILFSALLYFAIGFLLIGGTCEAQPKFYLVGGPRFSFGDIPQSPSVTHVLTIKNKGNKELVISNISASCGCTGTMMSNDHIAPKDSGKLSITFNPKTYSSSIEKTVTVYTNDTANAAVTIHFTANVIKIFEVDPEYVFLKTVVDSTSIQSVTIKNVSTRPIQFLSVRATSEFIKAKLSRESLDPGESTTLQGIVSPKSPGAVGGTIEIATDNKLVPVLNLRVFAWVRDRSK